MLGAALDQAAALAGRPERPARVRLRRRPDRPGLRSCGRSPGDRPLRGAARLAAVTAGPRRGLVRATSQGASAGRLHGGVRGCAGAVRHRARGGHRRLAGSPGPRPARGRGRTTRSTPAAPAAPSASSSSTTPPGRSPRATRTRTPPSRRSRGWRRCSTTRAPAGFPPSSSAAATSIPASRPALNVAQDGDRVAQLLVDHGASAYFYDRPEENRAGRIPAGGGGRRSPRSAPGTLGYRSAVGELRERRPPGRALRGQRVPAGGDQPRRRATRRRTARPSPSRLIPVIDGISMQALDGALLRRSRPALFQGLLRKPLAGDRWAVTGGDGVPSPSGADPYTTVPGRAVPPAACATRITPEYALHLVGPGHPRLRPARTRRRPTCASRCSAPTTRSSRSARPGSSARSTPGRRRSPSSAGGRAFTQRVSVLPGTRPASVRHPAAQPRQDQTRAGAAAAPATPPPPASAPPADLLPSLVRRRLRRRPPPAPRRTAGPRGAGAVVRGPARGRAASSSRPRRSRRRPRRRRSSRTRSRPVARPSASTRRSARRRSRPSSPRRTPSPTAPDDHLPVEPFLVGLALIAALAGVTIRPGRGRRRPAYAVNRIAFRSPRSASQKETPMTRPFVAAAAALRRHAAPAALVIACVALLASLTGAADAARKAVFGASTKPRPYGVLQARARTRSSRRRRSRRSRVGAAPRAR